MLSSRLRQKPKFLLQKFCADLITFKYAVPLFLFLPLTSLIRAMEKNMAWIQRFQKVRYFHGPANLPIPKCLYLSTSSSVKWTASCSLMLVAKLRRADRWTKGLKALIEKGWELGAQILFPNIELFSPYWWRTMSPLAFCASQYSNWGYFPPELAVPTVVCTVLHS